jgi:hypothetical protein
VINIHGPIPTPAADEVAGPNLAFLLAHWHEIPREAALAISPRLEQRAGPFFICDQFDYVSRQCLAQETKPYVCREYPWYGDPPRSGQIDSPRCSYWWDVPRAEWPEGVTPLTALGV